jgi:hypothetical protein
MTSRGNSIDGKDVAREIVSVDLLGDLNWRIDESPIMATLFSKANVPFVNQVGSGAAVRPLEAAVNRNKIVWSNELLLELPVDRFNGMERQIIVEPDRKQGITLGHLLDTLYSFYNGTALTQEDFIEVKRSVDEDNDLFEYKADALKKMGKVYWKELMGERVFFEGITVNPRYNTGYLSLGS